MQIIFLILNLYLNFICIFSLDIYIMILVIKYMKKDLESLNVI